IPSQIRKAGHEPAPEPRTVTAADLNGFRYLGLVVRTTGTVTGISDNLGGKTLEIADRGNRVAAFLPHAPKVRVSELPRAHLGDHVQLTGVGTQYSLEPPHDGGFQLLLASENDVVELPGAFSFSAWMPIAAGILILGGGVLWWLRTRRQGNQRRSMRAFHA